MTVTLSDGKTRCRLDSPVVHVDQTDGNQAWVLENKTIIAQLKNGLFMVQPDAASERLLVETNASDSNNIVAAETLVKAHTTDSSFYSLVARINRFFSKPDPVNTADSFNAVGRVMRQAGISCNDAANNPAVPVFTRTDMERLVGKNAEGGRVF